LKQSQVRDNSIPIERAYMHCHGFACTRSLDIGLSLAKDPKVDVFQMKSK